MVIRNTDPHQNNLSDDEILRRRTAQLDNELQTDPALIDEPAGGGGRMALLAIAFIAVLGVVFYGMNNSAVTPSATSTAQTTTTSPMTGPVTAPRAPAGQTTGSAITPSPMTPTPPAVVPSPSNPAATSDPAATPGTAPVRPAN